MHTVRQENVGFYIKIIKIKYQSFVDIIYDVASGSAIIIYIKVVGDSPAYVQKCFIF